MITFYDNQALFDANSTTSTAIALDKLEENTSQLTKPECLNDEESHPLQDDIHKRIQRVQQNYFLERRSFL
jgi:hypothetical protein